MPIDPQELEDMLDEAIGDSIDMDWTSRIGAKAIMRWLEKDGLQIVSKAETAWLIEMVEPEANKPPTPRWWHPEHGWMWDANRALRLSREIDAASYLNFGSRLPGKATEHVFLETPDAP